MSRYVWLTILLGIVAAVAGTLAGRISRSGSRVGDGTLAGSPILHVLAGRTDIGEVWETDRFEWSVPIENRGASSCHLSDVSSSCNCLTTSFSPTTIELGQTFELKVIIDLRPKGLPPSSTDRPVNVALDFTFDYDTGHSRVEKVQQIILRGTVKDALIAPRVCHLGSHSEAADILPLTTVNVRSVRELKTLTATAASPYLNARIVDPPTRVDGVSEYAVEVAFDTRPPKGRFESTLSLNAVMEDGTSPPPKTIRLLGAFVDDIQAEPAEILLAGRPVGDRVERDIAIRSLTGREVKVESVRAEGGGLEVTAPKQECRYVLKQSVRQVGEATTKIHVTARSNERTYEITIPVIAIGTDASK